MTLYGEGLIAIWADIKDEGVETYYAWHDNEHVAERVGIPGFIRGRRYIATDAAVQWYMMYETVSPEVQVGTDYLNRLNNPSPWTTEAIKHFHNTSRSLTKKVFSQAKGDGAELVIVGVGAEGDTLGALRKSMVTGLLPELYLDHGVIGVHYCETNVAGSKIETAEKKGRPVAFCNAVVMIETSRPGPAKMARDRLAKALAAIPGTSQQVPLGTYRLELEKLKLSF